MKGSLFASIAAMLMLLAACADGEPEPVSEPDSSDVAEQAAPDTPAPPMEPVEMSGTAWAANDSDGAVFTTYIDPDGTYRDFRDGEPWQIGSWDRPGDNRICLTPDNIAVESQDARLCWTVRPPGEDGVMVAVDEDGREVTLREVDYVAPEE